MSQFFVEWNARTKKLFMKEKFYGYFSCFKLLSQMEGLDQKYADEIEQLLQNGGDVQSMTGICCCFSYFHVRFVFMLSWCQIFTKEFMFQFNLFQFSFFLFFLHGNSYGRKIYLACFVPLSC